MDTWLLGTGGGIYQSVDGRKWTRVSVYDYGITALVVAEKQMLAACGSGLWQILPNDPVWVQMHDETLTEVMDVAPLPGDAVGVVAASAYGVATASRNEQGTLRWRWHTNDLPVNARFTHAIVAETATRWVTGTEAGILVTEDAGNTWQWTNLAGFAVRALRYEPGRWWAGSDSGVWRSEDGRTWRRAGTGLTDVAVYGVATTPNAVVLATETGVWGTDGSGGWRNCGLHAPVHAVGVHPERPDMWVAGCVPGGAWVTEHSGKSWSALPDLPGTVGVVVPPGGKR
ncbi:MAG: hypothetical protein O3B73_05225 [bacterium]|nr:hypothetical protein [bacterium]